MSKFEGLFLAHEFRTYNLEYIQIVKQGVKTVELRGMAFQVFPKIVKEKTRFIPDVRR